MAGPVTPPLPPRISGRIVLPRGRLAGTFVILCIPVLALFGIFGERWETKQVDAGPYRFVAQIPTRFRYKETNEITLLFQNRAAAPVTAVVRFAPSLLEGFSEIAFVPSEEKAYEVHLKGVPPGGEERMRVSIRAEHYGMHQGTIDVAASGVTTSVPAGIFIFP